MEKSKIINDAKKFLSLFRKNIVTKINNVCSKTGQYNVPTELCQKRTSRANRALIQWQAVKDNNLTIQQLETFRGGIVVEFLNNDFFDENNFSHPAFKELRKRLGDNDTVSSIICIANQDKSSSSELQRQAFKKLLDNTKVVYEGKEVIINESNYSDYALTQTIQRQGQDNGAWSGFLFVSIKGGQQDTIQTHEGKHLTLFNPACEMATKEVCLDIDLVVLYFAFLSVPQNKLSAEQKQDYNTIFLAMKEALNSSLYDSLAYKGNLLDYCQNHYCAIMQKGKLTDPIQVESIDIKNFDIKTRSDIESSATLDDTQTSQSTLQPIDFTHEEAVVYERYYFDKIKNCILSPARPTNIFWSFHLSNMLQQNDTLEQYFEKEEERVKKRKKVIKT